MRKEDWKRHHYEDAVKLAKKLPLSQGDLDRISKYSEDVMTFAKHLYDLFQTLNQCPKQVPTSTATTSGESGGRAGRQKRSHFFTPGELVEPLVPCPKSMLLNAVKKLKNLPQALTKNHLDAMVGFAKKMIPTEIERWCKHYPKKEEENFEEKLVYYREEFNKKWGEWPEDACKNKDMSYKRVCKIQLLYVAC